VHPQSARGRKLTVRGGAAARGFPNVKLFSRYVTLRLDAGRSRGQRLAQGGPSLAQEGRALTQGKPSLAQHRPFQIAIKGLSDIVGKAVTLVITIVAARTLVADAFGVMALAMATGWLLGVATDAGLSMHLARETARRRGQDRQLLIEVLRLRAGLAYVAATMIAFFTPQIVPPHWKMQFVLVVLAQLTGAIVETVAHYFRGIGRSEIESAIHASHRIATLALAMIVLLWWPRLDYLGAALLIPAVIALLAAVGISWRLSNAGQETHAVREVDTVRATLITLPGFVRDILPLGLGVLISALYFRIDVYFIERWQGLEAVGGYNAVFRLVEATRLVPAAVMAVTFPLLVQARDTRLVQRVGAALAIAGVAVAIACSLGSPLIVSLIYGQPYLYTAPTLAILALAVPLFFLNYALTHQVIGWDGQRSYLLIASLALVANVAANFVLVPSRGMSGAAIATLLTEVVVTAGCLYSLRVQDAGASRRLGTAIQHEGSAQ
jgi:O-antigen/teichoic acid export membrane protein